MVPRFAKLPIMACACLVAGVMIGVTLSPVIAQQAAQQMAQPDGQVALRSDGAIYLISGGQRRWIAPVVISDQEINAYPEGEPIFTGVAPLAAQPAPAPAPPSPSPASPPAAPPAQPAPAPPPANPVPAPPPANLAPNTQPANLAADPAAIPPSAASSVPAPAPAPPPNPAAAPPPAANPAAAPPPASVAQPTPTAVVTPTGAVGEMDPLLPIEVDISGTTTFERGDSMKVVVKTKAGASCELITKWPDGNEADESPQIADTRGRCGYSIKIPSNTALGLGTLTGTVRDGGRTSRQTVEYQVVANVQ